MADTYSDVCITSKDVCTELFQGWNESMRSSKGSYCSAAGESMGWVQGPYLYGYIYGYLASNDTYWLERFVKEFNRAICRPDNNPENECSPCLFTNETYDEALEPEPGWYEVSGWYSIDGKTRFDFIVGEGITMGAVALFIEAVMQDSSLHAQFLDDAEYYLWLLDDVLVPKWDRRQLFLEAETGGVYIFQNHTGHRRDSMSLPINQMGELALAQMTLYRITGKQNYKERVEKIISFFKSKWYNESGYVQWNYWDPAGPWDYFPDGSPKHGSWPDHRSGYSAIAATLVMEAYRNCMGIDNAEVQAFQDAMWHKKATKPGWYIPHSMAWLELDAKTDIRDRLLADPKSWGARTSGIPHFLYIMQYDQRLYSHCNHECVPAPEICGNGIDEDCEGEDAPCLCGQADKDRNNIIENSELRDYIKIWFTGDVMTLELMQAIGKWKQGC